MTDERAVAPTVAASAEADAIARDRLASLVDLLRDGAGGRLRAVVLSGSLARGEGVVVEMPSGPALLSDIDLYAVVDPTDATADAALAAHVRARFEGDPFLLAPLDLGVVGAGHFDGLGPTLPARQLGFGHRVLWSDARPWSPPSRELGAGAIDPDDAAKLLHNRCAEQLLLRGTDEREALFAAFHRWKIWRDAPLSFLAANGLYEPDRGAQIDVLAGLASTWGGAARAWLEAGLDRLRTMHRSLAAPLTTALVTELGATDLDLRGWVWPFHRAQLWRGLGATQTEQTLSRSVEEGPPRDEDARLQRRWLQRRGPWSTLREARRWAPLAGQPVSAWWRHGWNGTGPDRVHVAAASRFARFEQWQAPLSGLVDPPATDEAGLDAWLGGLWSSWIMGGSRR